MVSYTINSNYILEAPNSNVIRMRTKDRKQEILFPKSKLTEYFIFQSIESGIIIDKDKLDEILEEHNITINDIDATAISMMEYNDDNGEMVNSSISIRR